MNELIEELERVIETLIERDNQNKPLKADDRISTGVYYLHKIIMRLYEDSHVNNVEGE